MAFSQYVQSTEFKRQSNATADSLLKIFGRVLSDVVTFTINSIKLMVGQLFGK